MATKAKETKKVGEEEELNPLLEAARKVLLAGIGAVVLAQEEVEDFVKEELPPDWDDRIVFWPGGYGTSPQLEDEFQDVSKDFMKKLGQKGWHSLAWPEEYGGKNASVTEQMIFSEVQGYYNAPGIDTFGVRMI